MEWWVILIIAFVSLIVLFCLGLPVAFAFLALDIIGVLLLFGGKGMHLLSSSIFESVGSFTLSPIPMFVLLGEIFYQSQAVDICFDTIDKWVGGIRARLYLVTLLFATVFGAISGSGIAMAAMLGRTVLPEMVRRGYDKKLSIGVILGGATLDPLIPPSILAVLVGSLANISIAKILISGFGPGFLLSGFFIIYSLILVKLKPELAPVYKISSSLGDKILSTFRLLPFGLIIFLVIGLMILGITTPTESAAAGVMGALVLAVCFGKLTFESIKNSVLSTTKISVMILLIIAGSKAFSQILAISGGTRGLVELTTKFQLPPMVLLIIMQLICFFLGCFIDQVSIMMITIPVFLPVVNAIGFDPIWFWCLFLINMTLGAITPPFGLILFTLKGASPDTRLEEVYRAAIPFVLMSLLGIVLVIMFPGIAVWLPNRLYRLM